MPWIKQNVIEIRAKPLKQRTAALKNSQKKVMAWQIEAPLL